MSEQYGLTYSAVLYLKESEDDVAMVNKPCEERRDSAFCFYLEADKISGNHCMKELMVNASNAEEVNRNWNN